MFNLIPISLLVIALGGVVYIVSNHLSDFEESGEAEDADFKLRAKFVEWVNQMPVEKIKTQSLSLTQKTLHKVRLILLKSDNLLTKLIGRISEKEKEREEKKNKKADSVDFWQDISESKKEEAIPRAALEVKVELAVEKEREIEKFFNSGEKSSPLVDSLSKKRAVKAPRARKSDKMMPR